MEDTWRGRILNVDDNEAGRYSVTRVLRQAGFEVMEAATGEEALKLGSKLPDLVLLDVNLPDMNGFEVCRRLKSDPATRAIPILHLSATFKDSKAMVNGLDGGADGYLTQPVEPPVLLAHVNALIRSSKLERRLVKVNRSLKALSDCNQALLRAESESDLVREVCRILVEVAGHRFVWVGACESDPEKTIRLIAKCGEDDGLLELGKASWAETSEGCCPMGEAIRMGKPFLLQDIRNDSRCEPWRGEAIKRGFASAFALPLIVRGDVWGAISICSETTGIFDDEERQLLSELAQDLAYGIGSLRTREELRESEARYRMLFESAGDAIYILDAEGEERAGHIVSANPAAAEMHGYTVDELLNLSISDLDTPESAARVPERIERLLKGERLREEVTHRRKDGTVFPLEINACVLELGNRNYILAVDRDITERKQTEEQIRFQAHIIDNSPVIAAFHDKDLNMIWANKAYQKATGLSLEEIKGKKCYSVWNLSKPCRGCPVITAIETGENASYELTPYNQEHWPETQGSWLSEAAPERDERGAVIGAIEFAINITERRQAETALRGSEERYRYLVENIEDLICTHDLEGNLLFANSSSAHFLGFASADLVGTNLRSYLAPEVRNQFDGYLTTIRTEGSASGFMLVQAKSGEKRLWEYRNTLHMDTSGKPIVLGVARDVTERRKAEDALRESRESYQVLFNDSKDGVYITGRDGQLLDANQAYLDLFGYERTEIVGEDIRTTYVNPTDRDRFIQAIEERGFLKDYPLVLRRKDGKEIDCLLTSSVRRAGDGTVIEYQGIIRDVTEQRNLQKQLLQAQKMEAIGTLAGGVAHDFNNLLTVVMGFSELLLAEKNQESPEYEDLQKIFHAARNGAELVKRLLMFSRKSEPKPSPMDLNNEIVQVEKMLRRTIPKMIDVKIELSADLPRINADASQMEQILMNLAVNARDAMPDKGKLTLRTDIVTLDEDYCRFHIDAKPGEHVLLEVSDTGLGMDEETTHHIFEPFFTTKETGRGTGLGLAMVYGIVKQHNGHISVYSEVGHGTTFKIYLPAIPADEEPDAEVTGVMPAFGTETVLLVDDEEFVRELGARILAKHGYTVLQAVNGREALDLFKKERSQISLVILDLIMPEMGGTECLKELLKIDPQVKVLIASGYSGDASVKEIIQMGAKGFVTKPFRVKELLRDVRKVLDEEQDGASKPS